MAVVSLDTLATDWRAALHAASTALAAAADELPEPEIRSRTARLAAEVPPTEELLAALARSRHVAAPFLHLLDPAGEARRLLGLPPGTRACVFDLEGVLVGTAALHSAAWAETFDELLSNRIARDGVGAFEGVRSYLELAHEVGVGCAAVSASANTDAILVRAGLSGLIEERVDGKLILAESLRAKPEPDTLLAACRLLGVEPRRAVAFETTPAGVAAACAAGCALVVGVDRLGRADALRDEGADAVVSNLAELLSPAGGDPLEAAARALRR